MWLKSGIQADRLVLGNFKVERLYIKLDKKLTLKAESISIPKSKAKPSFKNVDKTFDTIKYLFTFFDYIELNNIHFENNTLNIIFVDETLYITSDDYAIAGNIKREGSLLVADVSMLSLKKENINIKGALTYNLNSAVLQTEGDFDAYNIKGRFFAKKEDSSITFKIQSDVFSDLKTLINKFALNEVVKSWVVDRVQAKHYTLHSLEGRGEITKEGLKIDFDALKGEVLFEAVKIYYQPNLDPVLAENLLLTYKKNALYFDLEKPEYKKRSLAGSRIAITGLGAKKTSLKLDLHMKTPIDDEVQQILKSYDITIPVAHKGEDANVTLKMDIPLKKDSEKEKSIVIVGVDLGQGELNYNKIKLPVLRAHASFDNRKKKPLLIQGELNKGTVVIGGSKFPVLEGKIAYKDNRVKLEDIHIKEEWYEGKLKGDVNLTSQKADLIFDAKEVSIGDKEKFLVLNKNTLGLKLDYSKNVKIDIPKLGLHFNSNLNETRITLDDLKRIKPYFVDKNLIQEGGNIEIKTKDFETYTFKGVLRRKSCFLYQKDDVCQTRVYYRGSASKEGVEFYAFDKRFHFSSAKSLIKLDHLNIDLKKFLAYQSKVKQKNRKSLVILGTKSKIRYSKYRLITDSYDIEIKPDGNIKAIGSLAGDVVKFSKKGKEFSLQAFRVTDKMLHPLINFSGLKKGRYSLKKSGDPDKVMKGQIIVEGGVMKGFKAYNNTLAFINTLPALATLQDPGFSEKGFDILEGVIEYRMIGSKKVIFDSIYIKGKSATIVGKGELDLKKKMINIKLAIQTARELGKFVGNLPLLGYILVGKDKSMTIGLTITGSLEKPTVKTTVVKDILTLPLQLLKRTLESPKHIINK